MKLKADRPYHLRFLRENLLNPEARRLGLSRVLPLVARGFSVEQIGLYGLTPGREHGYFPERARWRLTLGTNEELWPVLHDKSSSSTGSSNPTFRSCGWRPSRSVAP